MKCDFCGKTPQFGHNVSHSKRRTIRQWLPNIHPVTITVAGQPKRLHLCTRCLRNGAVRKAIRNGTIDDARFRSYQRLKRELKYLAARRDDRTRLDEKERWKKISQWAKQLKKNK